MHVRSSSLLKPCKQQTHPSCTVLPFNFRAAVHPPKRQKICKFQALTEDWVAPWAITFDIRERETDWTAENQERLVKLFAAEKLDIDALEAEHRMVQLCMLVPKLGSRIHTMHPTLLANLLRDPAAVAARLAALRASLPVIDLSSFAASWPQVLLKEEELVVKEVRGVAAALGIDFESAQSIVNDHPRFLDIELVQEVLDELKRLMPNRDASQILRAEPSWLLRVERGPKRMGPHPDDI